jgi:hypothetical protein
MSSNNASAAFQRKLAERRALLATQAEEKHPRTPGATEYDEFVPYEIYDGNEEDLELDRALAAIDIIDAYRKWCGKMSPKVGNGQRESIMISCPKPDHADKKPSAWINLDKQTWFCGGCQEGGDAYDIAAYNLGFPVPGYKEGATFHELRRKMAEDFGYTFHTAPGGVTYITPPLTEPEPVEESVTPVETPLSPTPPAPPSLSVVAPAPEPESTVVEIYGDDEDDYDQIVYPSLDWRSVAPSGTFLDVYMNQTMIDDVTEEYHFWNALIAIGMALGRKARLHDQIPVHGNLFVCTLGRSGAGKSKANPTSRGVRKINAPGSAEFLVSSFQKPVVDPANPKRVLYYAPVTGLIDFNELSALMGRANRHGSVMGPTLMQFYDMDPLIETGSLSSGVKEAHLPFASALTTSQPASLKNLVTKQDDASGFLNRWVFVGGPEKQRVAIGGAVVNMSPAVLPLQRILAWSGMFGDDDFVEWSKAAFDKFTEFFHDRIHPDQRRELNSFMLTRLDLLMKKVILLLAANKHERVVSGDTVDDAIKMYQYIVDCYLIPSAELKKTPTGEVEDAILRFAEKKGSVTLRDLDRSLKRRDYTRDMIVKALDVLVKMGRLDVEKPTTSGRGRPTVRYRYVA